MPDLAKFLKSRLSRARSVAVLGIGSELRSDDAAGLLVAEELEKRLGKGRKKRRIRIFFGSTAPENLTGEIKRFKPEHIIIADTVEMGEKPGTIIVVPNGDVGSGVTFSTHKMPAKILADYFIKSFKCEITMVGIQPSSLKFGAPPSRHIRESAKYIAKAIAQAAK